MHVKGFGGLIRKFELCGNVALQASEIWKGKESKCATGNVPRLLGHLFLYFN